MHRDAILDSDIDGVVRRDIHPTSHPDGADLACGYSYGVLVGRQLWVSGQVPFDIDGDLVGEGDIEAQAIQVHQNLRSVVEAAGGQLDDVVKITTYLSDPEFRRPVQAVRRRFFPGPRHPASATVVAQMVVPGILVEVEAIAILGCVDHTPQPDAADD